MHKRPRAFWVTEKRVAIPLVVAAALLGLLLAFIVLPGKGDAGTLAESNLSSHLSKNRQHHRPSPGPSPTSAAPSPTNVTGSLAPSPSSSPSPSPTATAPGSAGGGTAPDGVPASLVGALRFRYTGAQLTSHGFVTGDDEGADCSPGTNGTYSTDSSGDLLVASGGSDNCAEVTSTATYGTGIYEARIYFTSNWTAYWMSGPNWPTNGEIDALEVLSGRASSTYHSPSPSQGTDFFGSAAIPGWHTVDIVRQSSGDSVYYDGKLMVTWKDATTTDPENIIVDSTDGPGTVKVAYLASWNLS